MRVLLVEDNQDLAESLIEHLSILGYVCDVAFNGAAGLVHALKHEYDIYIFDVSMPRMDGLSLCQTLREEHSDMTPVLFLTARDTLDDKVAGFDVGADDYLVKPFDVKELHVRLQAIRKRYVGSNRKLEISDLSIDLDTQLVKRGDDEIILSPNSFKLLVTLVQQSPKTVSRQELEYTLWGDELPDSDSLRSHIYNLRKLIDKPYDRKLIQTVQGRGFRVS